VIIIDKYFTPDQAAELLHVKPKTIRQYITQGKLAASKMGKLWLISETDLENFIESKRIPVHGDKQ
jgi:excisionase family DNA binding protein